MSVTSNPRVPFRSRRSIAVGAVMGAVLLTGLPAAAATTATPGPGPVLVDTVQQVTVAAGLRADATLAAAGVQIHGFSTRPQLTQAQLVFVDYMNKHLAARMVASVPPSLPLGPRRVEAPGTAHRSYARPSGGVWAELAQCESGGDWSINTGAFDGGLQFVPSTWRAYGGAQYAPYAYEATPSEQIAIAERVLAATGGNYRASWPGCSAKLGLG